MCIRVYARYRYSPIRTTRCLSLNEHLKWSCSGKYTIVYYFHRRDGRTNNLSRLLYLSFYILHYKGLSIAGPNFLGTFETKSKRGYTYTPKYFYFYCLKNKTNLRLEKYSKKKKKKGHSSRDFHTLITSLPSNHQTVHSGGVCWILLQWHARARAACVCRYNTHWSPPVTTCTYNCFHYRIHRSNHYNGTTLPSMWDDRRVRFGHSAVYVIIVCSVNHNIHVRAPYEPLRLDVTRVGFSL